MYTTDFNEMQFPQGPAHLVVNYGDKEMFAQKYDAPCAFSVPGIGDIMREALVQDGKSYGAFAVIIDGHAEPCTVIAARNEPDPENPLNTASCMMHHVKGMEQYLTVLSDDAAPVKVAAYKAGGQANNTELKCSQGVNRFSLSGDVKADDCDMLTLTKGAFTVTVRTYDRTKGQLRGMLLFRYRDNFNNTRYFPVKGEITTDAEFTTAQVTKAGRTSTVKSEVRPKFTLKCTFLTHDDAQNLRDLAESEDVALIEPGRNPEPLAVDGIETSLTDAPGQLLTASLKFIFCKKRNTPPQRH